MFRNNPSDFREINEVEISYHIVITIQARDDGNLGHNCGIVHVKKWEEL